MIKLNKSILTALSGILLLGSQDAISMEKEVTEQEQVPTYTYEGNHMYKGHKIPDQLFDSSMDCGLDLKVIIHRYYKEGEKYYPVDYGKLKRVDSFENDVKNYAFAKHEVETGDERQMHFKKQHLDRLEESLLKSGLTKDQLEKIPAIKGFHSDFSEFVCKKISG